MHSCKIYVGNLAWATDENALGSHFNCIGKVNEAVVMRSEGRSRGFGFVTFSSSEEAERAITTMNDTELHGRRVRVNVANQHVRNSGNNSSELYTNVRPNQNFNHTMTSFPENAAHNYANFPYGGYPNQHPTHPGNNYVCGVSPALNYPMSISSQYDGAHSEMPIIDNSKGGGQSAGYYPVPGPYGYPPVGYGPQPY